MRSFSSILRSLSILTGRIEKGSCWTGRGLWGCNWVILSRSMVSTWQYIHVNMLSAYPRDWPGVAYSTLPSNPEPKRTFPMLNIPFCTDDCLIQRNCPFFCFYSPPSASLTLCCSSIVTWRPTYYNWLVNLRSRRKFECFSFVRGFVRPSAGINSVGR